MSMPRNNPYSDLFITLQCEENIALGVAQKDMDILMSGEFIQFVEGLQIITKSEGRKSLLFNPAQEQLHHWYLGKREAKVKARGISTKSRREGVSTYWMAIGFACMILRPDFFCFLASHENPSRKFIFDMARTFWRHSSQEWKVRRRLITDTSWEMKCDAPHNSSMTSATANNAALGSGQLIHHLHMSELAKWKNPPANDAYTSVLQCVPNHWDTLVFIESTAWGAHNLFHQLWLEAKAQRNDYEALFLSWKDFPEYFFYFIGDKDVPENATVVEKPTFTKEELEFQEKWSVCDRQMAWASDVRRNQCHNSWDEFNQEYPIHDSLAFKFSGHRWFDADGIEKIAALNYPKCKQFRTKDPLCKRCSLWGNFDSLSWISIVKCPHSQFHPIATGNLVWDSKDKPVVKWKDDPNGLIEIWRWPEKGRRYVGFEDVAQGVGADWTVEPICRLPEIEDEFPHMEQVAKLRSNRITSTQAGEMGVRLAIFYNRAFLGIESNDQGNTTCQVAERGLGVPQLTGGYSNLYYDIRVDGKEKKQTKHIGWRTGPASKQLMLGDAKEVIRKVEMWIHSVDTLLELEGFCWDPARQDWVQSYMNEKTRLAHDDEVIALAGTKQMAKHYQSCVVMAEGAL
jgi:hypothetical protein